MAMLRIFLVFLACQCAALASTAGERHAILIGVENYEASVSGVFPTLRGPVNDVALMQKTLQATFDGNIDISVLGGGSHPAPTRAAILSSLDRLANRAGVGDEIIIYLSGHGTQLPSPVPGSDEPDGLDEVFLPSDTRLVQTSSGYGLRNHIRDTEFGARIARMERAGSFVWLIVDSCHAGTMLRGTDAELVPRMVNIQARLGSNVQDLNPPPDAGRGQFSVLDVRHGGKFSQGRFVAFYAAAPDALAFELPTGTQPEVVHGLFTISLAEALNAAGSFSFSDLARETAARMWSRAGPQPQAMFQGALTHPLFGRPAQNPLDLKYALRFQDRRLVLQAGRLQGVMPGAMFTVHEGSGAERRPVFTTQVAQSALDIATLEIVAHSEAAPNNLPQILAQDGLPYAEFKERWLADRQHNLTAVPRGNKQTALLTVRSGQQMTPDFVDTFGRAIELTFGRVRLAGSNATMVTGRSDNALILRPNAVPGSTPEMPFHIGPAATTPALLAQQLSRIAAAHALVAVASTTQAQMMTDAIDMQVARLSAPSPVEGDSCDAYRPGLSPHVPPAAQPFSHDPDALPRILHCDQVFLTLKNTSTVSLDVSPLYVSSRGEIYYLSGYRGGAAEGLRIPAGASRHVEFTESVDRERSGQSATILILAVPSKKGPARDFRHLTRLQQMQPVLDKTALTRGGDLPKKALDLRYAATGWHFISGVGQ